MPNGNRDWKNKIKDLLIKVIGIVIFIFGISQSFSSDIQLHCSKCLDKKSIVDETKYPGFCTIFCITKGNSVFFGNNEDWKNPNTFIWVERPTDSTYGVVYLGFDDLFPQGGINEKGLAFDANALPGIKLKEHRELLKPYQAIVNTYILQKCATVGEAMEMAKSYDWGQSFGGILSGQFLLADATGDAVVISSDQNGDIVFTRKLPGDEYLVSTNFNRAFPDNKFGSGQYWHYETATNMFDTFIKEDSISTDLLVNVLDAVHEEGNNLNTLYSNIFDLKQGIIYLYHWHQFDQEVSINVSDWINSKPEPQRIESLFNEETVRKAKEEYKSYQNRKKKIFIIITLTSFALTLIIYLLRKKMFVPKVKSD